MTGRVAIESGAIGAAAACGVMSTAAFLTSGLFNSAGMLAPDGRCKTLDAAANGAASGAHAGYHGVGSYYL
jgi:acyl transferase domain-containing protein